MCTAPYVGTCTRTRTHVLHVRPEDTYGINTKANEQNETESICDLSLLLCADFFRVPSSLVCVVDLFRPFRVCAHVTVAIASRPGQYLSRWQIHSRSSPTMSLRTSSRGCRPSQCTGAAASPAPGQPRSLRTTLRTSTSASLTVTAAQGSIFQ